MSSEPVPTPSDEGQNPEARWEIITPEMAKGYLLANVNNRNARPAGVDRMARDMREGKWLPTGDSIKFDTNGHLIDGQHRLMACVLAGVPFKTLVIRGLAPETFITMDVNIKRSFSDMLKHMGEQNVACLAGAIEASLYWEETGKPGIHGKQHSHSERMAWLIENPDIREAVHKSWPLRHAPLKVSAAISGAFALRAYRISPADADAFIEHLKTGADLSERDPIFRLRAWLLRARETKGRLNREEYAAVMVKAWNHWLRGDEVHNLRWRSGGARAEAFPFMETPDGRTYEEIITDPTYLPPGVSSPEGTERMQFPSQDEPGESAA